MKLGEKETDDEPLSLPPSPTSDKFTPFRVREHSETILCSTVPILNQLIITYFSFFFFLFVYVIYLRVIIDEYIYIERVFIFFKLNSSKIVYLKYKVCFLCTPFIPFIGHDSTID